MSALELVLGDRVPQDLVAEALRGWFTIGNGPGISQVRVYYDTFDGLLHARGLTLSYQRGRLLLEPLNPEDDGASGEATQAPMASEPRVPLATSLPVGKLGSSVESVIGKRALLELARLRVQTEVIAILDEREKTVVRVLCEEAELIGGRHDGVRLQPRLRITGLRGYERQLGQVVELLKVADDVRPAKRPLLDEAVITDGRDPSGVDTKVRVRLDADERADVAVTSVLTALLAILDVTLPGTIAGVDTEFLHDYRVAVRRTRSVLREFKAVFEADRLTHIRDELRWLQDATGPTRDYDVYVQDFDALRELAPGALHDDYEPLATLLAERRAAARGAMVEALQSERAVALRDALGVLAADPGGGELASHPITELAAARVRHLHQRMVNMGSEITPDTPPHDYHQLRKRGKELRYVLELFGEPLYDPEVVRALVRSLKALQNVLGRHQDREVQIAVLRDLADDVVERPGGVMALLATGVLIDRLEEDAEEARGEFTDVFKDFSSAQQRKLVRWTFRAPDPPAAEAVGDASSDPSPPRLEALSQGADDDSDGEPTDVHGLGEEQ